MVANTLLGIMTTSHGTKLCNAILITGLRRLASSIHHASVPFKSINLHENEQKWSDISN